MLTEPKKPIARFLEEDPTPSLLTGQGSVEHFSRYQVGHETATRVSRLQTRLLGLVDRERVDLIQGQRVTPVSVIRRRRPSLRKVNSPRQV